MKTMFRKKIIEIFGVLARGVFQAFLKSIFDTFFVRLSEVMLRLASPQILGRKQICQLYISCWLAMPMLAWHAYVQRSATAHPKQPGGAPTVGILRTCSLHLVSPICFPQIISWKCSQCARGSSSELLATTTSSSTGNC